jgi:hypothetical protein
MRLPGGTKREGRVFALTMAGGFLFVAAVTYWRGAETIALVASVLAAIFILAAAIVPGRLEPVRLAWMKLGELIGRVTTPVLMAIVYFVVVTPVAIVRRTFSGRRESADASAWHERPEATPRERMERQF